MKLNFWQWIGVALLVFGVAWAVYHHFNKPDTNPSPSTQKSGY